MGGERGGWHFLVPKRLWDVKRVNIEREKESPPAGGPEDLRSDLSYRETRIRIPLRSQSAEFSGELTLCQFRPCRSR